MATSFRDKRIIITAGPTWVRIDDVRVISNAASGLTGILLAQALHRLGAKVTLLLGPVSGSFFDARIRLLRFKFFDELKVLLKKELSSKRYDLAIHSAAVSDYRPVCRYKKKIASGLNDLKISLKATPKLIYLFKNICPSIALVAFKFEPDASRKKLILEARKLINSSKAEFVIANTLKKDKYIAYLITAKKCSSPVFTKKGLVNKLIQSIREIDA